MHTRRMARVVTVLSLVVAGLLFTGYGVLALTYEEGEGSSTHVTFAGAQVGAHLAGAVSLAIGLVVVVVAVLVARSGRLRS